MNIVEKVVMYKIDRRGRGSKNRILGGTLILLITKLLKMMYGGIFQGTLDFAALSKRGSPPPTPHFPFTPDYTTINNLGILISYLFNIWSPWNCLLVIFDKRKLWSADLSPNRPIRTFCKHITSDVSDCGCPEYGEIRLLSAKTNRNHGKIRLCADTFIILLVKSSAQTRKRIES